MFSGLTNQVSSWMNKVHHGDSLEGGSVESSKDPSSENKRTSQASMHAMDAINQVQQKIKVWFPGRNQETAADEEKPNADKSPDDSTDAGDDVSSATGSADSHVESEMEACEDDPSSPAVASVMAMQGVKNFGSFLYSAVNKAGKSVSVAGAKVKKAVEENAIIGDLNKEQEDFIKNKGGASAQYAKPPWFGSAREEELKAQILSLSTDRKNFLRSPPPGVEFHFDYDKQYAIALETLKIDPDLRKMRFDLVPKFVAEENFWRNYFYRVGLLCQEYELSSLVEDGKSLKSSIGKSSSQKDWEKELDSELSEYEMVDEGRDRPDERFDVDDDELD